MGEDALPAVPQQIASKERQRSGQDADDDASAGTNIIVVDQIFERKGDTDDQGDDADPVDPGESDLGFDFALCRDSWRWRLGDGRRWWKWWRLRNRRRSGARASGSFRLRRRRWGLRGNPKGAGDCGRNGLWRSEWTAFQLGQTRLDREQAPRQLIGHFCYDMQLLP